MMLTRPRKERSPPFCLTVPNWTLSVHGSRDMRGLWGNSLADHYAQRASHALHYGRYLLLAPPPPMTMKVGIRFGVCNNPPAELLHCECT